MTMDILWAISQGQGPARGNPLSASLFPGMPVGSFPNSGMDAYEDYVGGLQFWGYGLVSGSADGVVRMWDSKNLFQLRISSNAYLVRTGQSHRTLLGHTAPITCLQFDELHVMSGSLDCSIKVKL